MAAFCDEDDEPSVLLEH